MYKFLILFFVAVLFFPSCGQIDPIVQDVCEITEEICFYANLVCENFEPSKIESMEDEKLKSELISLKDDLFYLNVISSPTNKNAGLMSDENFKYKLIEIRDQLKRLAEQQKILK